MEQEPKKEGEQLKIEFKEQTEKDDLAEREEELFSLCEKLGKNYLEETGKIARELQQKYPDCRDYLYFHNLIGSDVSPGECKKKDFPGADSISNSLNSLLTKLRTDYLIKQKKEKGLKEK